MPENNQSEVEFRVLVVMPTGRDAALVCQTLAAADFSAAACQDFPELAERVGEGVGAILLAEESLNRGSFERLIEVIQQQPVWSDIPVVLLASKQRTETLLNGLGTLLNITIVERPLPKAILISAMRGAIRARKKQYQTRDLLARLKEADMQKDLFLATLSHELRTPLNSMLGWIKLLQTEKNTAFDQTHALNVIERNAKAQTQIINDILLISRIVTGKFEIEVKNINVKDILDAALGIIEPSIKEKNIDLEVSCCEDGSVIEGDFDRLQQVFWNLLSNAVKFTPKNGAIKINTKREEPFFVVDISDNGEGINAEFLPFIFERFRQADNSYTRSVGGLGLGLSIVRNIVEQHGGRVSVSSDGLGKGTTFTIRLPLAEVSEEFVEQTPQTVPGIEQKLAQLKVLLVEDDDDSREMLVFLLEQNQLEIEAVTNAAAALEAITRNPPQLLISDVGMPEMDGYQLIENIRQLSPENGGLIPAIALTGYAGSQDQARSLNSGYQAHLTKPIDFDLLFKTIQQLLG